MTTTSETLNYPVLHKQVDEKKDTLNFINNEIIEDVSSSSDFDLTKAAAQGNMAAFEEVYQRHHRRVYSICLRMLQNATEAEDLTQDVFIQLYRKIGSFRGDSAFTTWLHRLTVNQVLMHTWRRLKKFINVIIVGFIQFV